MKTNGDEDGDNLPGTTRPAAPAQQTTATATDKSRADIPPDPVVRRGPAEVQHHDTATVETMHTAPKSPPQGRNISSAPPPGRLDQVLGPPGSHDRHANPPGLRWFRIPK